MANKGLLLIISGPSGVGKGTICAKILAENPDIVCSVSATTRSPRKGEIEGKSYYFLSREEFLDKIHKGEFLEWAEVFGNFYGTPADKIADLLEEGKSVILEIDTQGAMQIKSACPEGVSIFILPPSFEELQSRIVNRGTETKEIIDKRLSCAKAEMEFACKYDYSIVNDTVDHAAAQIISIIKDEQMKRR